MKRNTKYITLIIILLLIIGLLILYVFALDDAIDYLAQEEVTVEIDDESSSEIIEERELTDLEIEFFNQEYFYTTDYWSSYNGVTTLLMDYFESPDMLNINNYLDYFGSDDFEDGEYDVIFNAGYISIGPLDEAMCGATKVSYNQLNDMLKDYFGITIDEVDESIMNSLHYLEEYNSFYGCSTALGYTQFTATSGVVTEDKIIFYGDNGFSTEEVVTLVKVDGAYKFYSYLPAE